MLVLREGGGTEIHIANYSWDAGQTKPVEFCKDIWRPAGPFKCTLRDINPDLLMQAFKGEGPWLSVTQPDRVHSIDIIITENSPLGDPYTIEFKWFRVETLDGKDNTLKVTGMYLDEDY